MGAGWKFRSSLTAILVAVSVLGSGCAPLMIERDGHRVFNPTYRYFLTWGPRADWQMPGRVVDALDLAPGQAVADIGAGNGYFVASLANAVGTRGRVFATDVQDEMIEDLQELVRVESLVNVEVVRGGYDDPALSAACCDLVFFANVYKEISHRVAFMQRIEASLKPNGRVAIVGFEPGHRGPGPPEGVRLDAEKVIAELGHAGFALERRHGFLPRQHFLIFTRAQDQRMRSSASQSAASPSNASVLRAASIPDDRAP